MSAINTLATQPSAGTSGSWLLSRDHRRIGIVYLWSCLFALFVSAFLGWLTTIEMSYPGRTLVAEADFHLLGAGHGVFLVFFFILPAIPAGLGNFILPLQLGAENVFHPGMNRFALHTFLLALTVAVIAALLGGADAAWAPFAPYDLAPSTVATWTMAAAALAVFSMMVTSLNFIGTVHLRRAEGQSWSKLPVSAWAFYLYSWVHILAAPAAVMAYGAMLMSRGQQLPFADPETGFGFTQIEMFFWFFAAPVVLMAVLPVIGVVTEVLSAMSKRRPAAADLVVYVMAALAVTSFMVWGRELFAGASEHISVISSVASFLICSLVLTVIFAWIGTLTRPGGEIRRNASLLYAVFAVVFLAMGVLSGLFTASLSLGAYLRPSLFGSGQFQLFVICPVIMGLLAGLHYWWPKISGRGFHSGAASAGAWVLFAGLMGSSLANLMMGIWGIPARAYSNGGPHSAAYLAELGTSLVLVGLLLALGNLARRSSAEPETWQGAGLEWKANDLLAESNFSEAPDGHADPYEFS